MPGKTEPDFVHILASPEGRRVVRAVPDMDSTAIPDHFVVLQVVVDKILIGSIQPARWPG